MGQVINLQEYKDNQVKQQLDEAYKVESINTIERIYDKVDLYQKLYLDPKDLFTKLKVIENFIDLEIMKEQAKIIQGGNNENNQ